MEKTEELLFYRPDLLGENILYLRKEHGFTQEELSKTLSEKYNISFSAKQISNYERGNYSSEIKAKNLLALSKLFGISTDSLLNNHIETDDMPLIINKLGIDKKSIKTLKTLNMRKNTKAVNLLTNKLKLLEKTSETDIVNHLLSSTDFLESFKKQAEEVIKQKKETTEIIEELKATLPEDTKDRNKVLNRQIKNCKEQLRDTMNLALARLNIELNRSFEQYIKSK